MIYDRRKSDWRTACRLNPTAFVPSSRKAPEGPDVERFARRAIARNSRELQAMSLRNGTARYLSLHPWQRNGRIPKRLRNQSSLVRRCARQASSQPHTGHARLSK